MAVGDLGNVGNIGLGDTSKLGSALNDKVQGGAAKLIAEQFEGVMGIREEMGCDPVQNAKLKQRNAQVGFLKEAALMGVDGKLATASPLDLANAACSKPIFCDTLGFSANDVKDQFKKLPSLADVFVGNDDDELLAEGKDAQEKAENAMNGAVDQIGRTVQDGNTKDVGGLSPESVNQRSMWEKTKDMFGYGTEDVPEPEPDPEALAKAFEDQKTGPAMTPEELFAKEERAAYIKKWTQTPLTQSEWEQFPFDELDNQLVRQAHDMAMGTSKTKSKDVYSNPDKISNYDGRRPGMANRFLAGSDIFWDYRSEPHPDKWNMEDENYGLYIDSPYRETYNRVVDKDDDLEVDTWSGDDAGDLWERSRKAEYAGMASDLPKKPETMELIRKAAVEKSKKVKVGFNETMSAINSQGNEAFNKLMEADLCDTFCNAKGDTMAGKLIDGIVGDIPEQLFIAGATNALSCMGFNDKEIVDVFKDPSSITQIGLNNPLVGKGLSTVGDIVTGKVGDGINGVATELPVDANGTQIVSLNAVIAAADGAQSGGAVVGFAKAIESLAKDLLPEPDSTGGASDPCALNEGEILSNLTDIEKDVVNSGFAPPTRAMAVAPIPAKPLDTAPPAKNVPVTASLTYEPQIGGRVKMPKGTGGYQFPVYNGMMVRKTMWTDGRFDTVRFYCQYVDVDGDIKIITELNAMYMDKHEVLSNRFFVHDGTPTGCEKPARDYADAVIGHETMMPNRLETRYYKYKNISVKPNSQTELVLSLTADGEYLPVLPPGASAMTVNTTVEYF